MKLITTVKEISSVETIIANSLVLSSIKRMTAVSSQISLQRNHSKDAKAEISSQDLAVHQRVPALKEKEIVKLITTVLEILFAETTIANSLVLSSMKRMIAVSNLQFQ